MTPAAEQFGRAVRQARLDAWMSQQQLARASGHSVSTIRGIEVGGPTPWLTLGDVARVLGLDVDRALGRAA